MLMVDELITIGNESVKAKFTIDKNCIFVLGSKLSESGIIENAAQTCSCIVGKGFFDKDDVTGKSSNLVGFISTIKTAKIYHLPCVDDEIITQALLISKFESEIYTTCTMSCEITNNDVMLAEFVINLFIQEV